MTPWTEDDILANGVKIHYLRTGRGDKPGLVLSHGFSGSGWSWYETACALEADFDLVLPDMRGHGRSQRCRPGEQIDMVADLAGVVTALGLDRPLIGGHSLGANYAARVAACNPVLVSGLILVDPAWYRLPPGVPDEPRPPSAADSAPGEDPYDKWLAEMVRLPIEAVVEEVRKLDPRKDEAALRRWAETVHNFDTNFFTVDTLTHIDFPEITTKITCPTLLITGEARLGAVVGVHQARWIMETNPRFEVVRLPGAGHNVYEDNFAGYIQALKDFLARYLAAR